MQSVSNANVSRSYSYYSYSRLNRETVTIDSLTRSSSFSYDDSHRPTAVTYHGGEVVTTKYGSPGAAVGLTSSVHGDLVDNVSFDEAGRMTALRLPAAGGLWRTQSYYPWTVRRNGGMLESLKVGLSEGGAERLSRSYAYNSFGDITALTEETTSYTFGYDGLGRLTSAYGRTYSYDAANRLTSFNGQVYNYYDAGPYHAVDRIDDFDRFDYDRSPSARHLPDTARRLRKRQHDRAQQGAERPADAGVGRREPAVAGAGSPVADSICRTLSNGRMTTATWSSVTGTVWRGCGSRRRAEAPRPTPSSRTMRRRSPTV